MNDIRRLISAARRRLEWTRFLGWLHLTLLVLSGLTLALAISDRLVAEPFLPWIGVGPALGVLAVVLAMIFWSRRRPTELQVAVEVDDRLRLKEKLSTALHCDGRTDPFALAALQDAVTTARDARVRESLGRRFPVAAPGRWWISPVMIMVAVGVLFLPQANLFAADEEEATEDVTAVKIEVQTEITRILQSAEDSPLLKDELGEALEGLTSKPDDAKPLTKPAKIQRDAIKRLTELNRKLDDLLEGEKGKTARALEQMMAKLRVPEDGHAKELAEALAKGNFTEARKAMEKMLADLEKGNLNEEQKKQLADQMQQIADQLKQLAQQQQALEQALKQAGLNPQLANNPQALKQALQNAQNLNQQQKQQLQQMMKAQQAAQQMCQGMGGACQSMAQSMKNGSKPGQKGAGQQMQNQLSQAEAMQQMLNQAQAMAGQCQAAAQGLGQGLGQGQGGMGGQGQGRDGEAPLARTPFRTKSQKADAPVGEGEIIARMLIQGEPIRGESKARLRQVEAALAEGYDEAQPDDVLPRVYHETLKHYFGELEKQVRARIEETEAEPEPVSESSGESSGESTGESTTTETPAAGGEG